MCQWWRNGAPWAIAARAPSCSARPLRPCLCRVRRCVRLLSMLWGWAVDRLAPDRFDVIGVAICLVGVAVIMYWPR